MVMSTEWLHVLRLSFKNAQHNIHTWGNDDYVFSLESKQNLGKTASRQSKHLPFLSLDLLK